MDLIDEENVAGLKVGERAHQLSLLDDSRAAGHADAIGDAHFLGDHVRQRRLPQARRAVQQDVLQRLVSLFGRGQGDAELFDDLTLSDALIQPPRTQGPIGALLVLVAGVAADHAF